MNLTKFRRLDFRDLQALNRKQFFIYHCSILVDTAVTNVGRLNWNKSLRDIIGGTLSLIFLPISAPLFLPISAYLLSKRLKTYVPKIGETITYSDQNVYFLDPELFKHSQGAQRRVRRGLKFGWM